MTDNTKTVDAGGAGASETTTGARGTGTPGDGDRTIARAVDERTRGLVAKRDQLLDETKKLKSRLSAYDGVDPDEYRRLKQAADKLQTEQAEVEGDWQRLRENLEQRHTEEVNRASKALEEERGFTRRLLVDQGLTQALMNQGVAQPLIAGAKALLAGHADIVAEGSGRKAVIKTDIGTLDLDTYVAEWVQTPEGKAYVGAPRSAGGGAHETNGKGGERRLRRRDLSSDAEKARFIRENGRDAYLALAP